MARGPTSGQRNRSRDSAARRIDNKVLLSKARRRTLQLASPRRSRSMSQPRPTIGMHTPLRGTPDLQSVIALPNSASSSEGSPRSPGSPAWARRRGRGQRRVRLGYEELNEYDEEEHEYEQEGCEHDVQRSPSPLSPLESYSNHEQTSDPPSSSLWRPFGRSSSAERMALLNDSQLPPIESSPLSPTIFLSPPELGTNTSLPSHAAPGHHVAQLPVQVVKILKIYRDSCAQCETVTIQPDWDDETLLRELRRAYDSLRGFWVRLFSLKCARSIYECYEDDNDYLPMTQPGRRNTQLSPHRSKYLAEIFSHMQKPHLRRTREEFVSYLTAMDADGIHFVESYEPRRVALVAVMPALLILIFAVMWAHFRRDTSTAFTIAGFLISAHTVCWSIFTWAELKR
ncbi:hypothetical protein NEOLEDRAFT_804163 [Neolentinus lepideus HHB14362 ss-1]|uniref:Uncharacterized protein n=1 Tax=Neolentinus lepideus HHB14362 ss-1 TaxID=1314782 RepID=A0A165PJ99_9AGAM|nr:hypothetical protein NEOLEDRAFT_804163 [Neolentinus lepideus HHB14362 ss-1]